MAKVYLTSDAMKEIGTLGIIDKVNRPAEDIKNEVKKILSSIISKMIISSAGVLQDSKRCAELNAEERSLKNWKNEPLWQQVMCLPEIFEMSGIDHKQFDEKLKEFIDSTPMLVPKTKELNGHEEKLSLN